LLSLPVPRLTFQRDEDRHSHQQVVKSVTEVLHLHRRLASARTPQEIRAAEREITSTDRQIDQLVYELYALTDKEIRIVEEATER
jgi:predicted DNA binding protein